MKKLAFALPIVVTLLAAPPDRDRLLAEAVLLYPIRPSVSKHLFEQLDAGRRVRFGMATEEWDLAIRAASGASRETAEDLLERLYAERPRQGADLFGSLLADMPAAVTKREDLLFIARNMLVVAKIDPEIAQLAAERIEGSLGPSLVQDPTLLAASGFVLKKTKEPPALPPRSKQPRAKPDTADLEAKLQAEVDEAFALPEYRGQIVFVTFWASWCAPCRREMPRMLKTGIPMVQITDESDPDNRLHKQFEVSTLPVTIVFDRNGRAVARLSEEQTDESLAHVIERARK